MKLKQYILVLKIIRVTHCILCVITTDLNVLYVLCGQLKHLLCDFYSNCCSQIGV